MCGICGIVNLDKGRPPDVDTLMCMMGRLRHRGASWIMPALETAYEAAEPLAPITEPAIEEVITIEPRPASSMCGIACFEQRKAPVRLTPEQTTSLPALFHESIRPRQSLHSPPGHQRLFLLSHPLTDIVL